MIPNALLSKKRIKVNKSVEYYASISHLLYIFFLTWKGKREKSYYLQQKEELGWKMGQKMDFSEHIVVFGFDFGTM